MVLTDDPTATTTPRAPTQAEWDAMTPAQRNRVVAELPMSLTEAELSPPEGDLHLEAKLYALDVLRTFYRRQGRSVYVGSELTVYYPGAQRFCPDLLVVFDVDPRPRDKWVVSAEGKGVDFVLEVHVGGDRRKDAERNVSLYASVGISEYFMFDRSRARLLGFSLPPGGGPYVPILGQHGVYSSRMLGLDLVLEGDRLRFVCANAPLLDTTEWLDRLRETYAALEARIDEQVLALAEQTHLREEETRLREEATRLREEETLRREEETRLREEAEARVAELLAELEKLGRGQG